MTSVTLEMGVRQFEIDNPGGRHNAIGIGLQSLAGIEEVQ